MQDRVRMSTLPWLVASSSLLSCGDPACPPGSARDAGTGLCTLFDDTGPSGEVGGGDAGAGGTTGGGAGSGTDTGGGGPGSRFTSGDPISVLASAGEPGGPDVDLIEWVEATAVGDSHVVLSGQGGAQLFSLVDGAAVGPRLSVPRKYRSAADGVEVVFGGRTGSLHPVSFADPASPVQLDPIPEPPNLGYYEDIAYADGLLLLGAHETGGVLIERGGTRVGTLPASDAYGVGLAAGRAVLTDRDELVLFDITEPGSPVELDRLPMGGEGRDVDFDGARVAVGLGGRGVAVWDVEADLLVPRGAASLPGAALDVSLDGDEVWVGAWESAALVRVGGDGLTVIGLEAPRFSAMAVGARAGRAVVADWYGMQLLERTRDVAGPELSMPTAIRFQSGGAEVSLDVRNWGPEPLAVELDADGTGFSVSPAALTVPSGGVERVRVVAPEPLPVVPTPLPWTSSDPDEPSGVVSLAPADRGVGTVHPDFSLQGLVGNDPELQTFNLADQRGKVVVLAYFALF